MLCRSLAARRPGVTGTPVTPTPTPTVGLAERGPESWEQGSLGAGQGPEVGSGASKDPRGRLKPQDSRVTPIHHPRRQTGQHEGTRSLLGGQWGPLGETGARTWGEARGGAKGGASRVAGSQDPGAGVEELQQGGRGRAAPPWAVEGESHSRDGRAGLLRAVGHGRTWNADAWLSKGRPSHRHHRARGTWGGRIPGLARPPGRAPQGSFVGRSAPARPWSSPPGRQAAPPPSRDPRTAGPSQGPEFRSCFHLQRNFPGPLGCGASPTNRPEPAPAARPAPGKLMAASPRGWIGSRPFPGA